MLEQAIKHESFQLKGSLFTLTVLQLMQPDINSFYRQLSAQVEQAPKFFDHAPIILDLQGLPNTAEDIDFIAICKALRDKNIIPVGVRGGSQMQHNAARLAGMAVMSVSKQESPSLQAPNVQSQPVDTASNIRDEAEQSAGKSSKEPNDKSKASAAASKPTARTSRIITKPVRSGQQIYAQGADLIVIGSVSHGAELLADGNIHIYGPLRGRALAGIKGDTNARIFCERLEAELVSVAGCYIVNEAIINIADAGPRQILLSEGKLQIVAL